MTDLVKPTLRDIKADHILLNAATNDLRNKNTDSQIVKAIIDITASLKNDGNNVQALFQAFEPLFNNKANEANHRLVLMCNEGLFHYFQMMKIMILSRT